MSGVRTTLILFAITVTILSHLAYDQEQVVNESCRRWLDWSEEEVGPDFSLKVSFHGRPVAGTRITLNKAINASGDGVVASAKTDPRGIARFHAIPKGRYYPYSSEGLLFPSGFQIVEVKTEHAHVKQVKIDWPSTALTIRNLRGRFGVSEDPSGPEIPLRNAIVELRDVYTAKLIESGATDANGDYEFATTAPGIYALRLILPKEGEPGFENRDLAVELDPAAEEISIPEMKVVQSDCYGVELLRRSATGNGWDAQ